MLQCASGQSPAYKWHFRCAVQSSISSSASGPCPTGPYISWWPSVLQVSSRSTLQAIGIGCGKESGAPRLPLGTFIVSACFNDLFRVASHFFSASSFPLLACKSRPWRHWFSRYDRGVLAANMCSSLCSTGNTNLFGLIATNENSTWEDQMRQDQLDQPALGHCSARSLQSQPPVSNRRHKCRSISPKQETYNALMEG